MAECGWVTVVVGSHLGSQFGYRRDHPVSQGLRGRRAKVAVTVENVIRWAVHRALAVYQRWLFLACLARARWAWTLAPFMRIWANWGLTP